MYYYGIMNTSTDRLLSIDLEVDDAGFYEPEHVGVMELYDSAYPGAVFLSGNKNEVERLIRDGQIDNNFRIKIVNADKMNLQLVKYSLKPPSHTLINWIK